MENYKTPIEQIFFRSSKIGLIVMGVVRHGLTEDQQKELDRFDRLLTEPRGITPNQEKKFNTWKEKISNGGKLSDNQQEKYDDYKKRLITPIGLTDKQEQTRKEYLYKKNRPPELTDGAKSYVKEVWLQNEKGFYEEVTDKKLRKGKQAEEDGINLISYLDRVTYYKNTKRVSKNNLTGECDVIHYNKEIDALIIDDIKCSWNPRTFMNATLTTIYEWQGRAYLYLYDADIFRLRHCLVDCPPDVLSEEYKKYCFQHNIIDDADPKYSELIEQFNRNYLYEKSGYYSKEERVKTFMFERDYDREEEMKLAIKLGVEYYKTIKLNMIEK